MIMPGDPKRCVKIAQYFDNPVLVADNRNILLIQNAGRREGERDIHRDRRAVRVYCDGRAVSVRRGYFYKDRNLRRYADRGEKRGCGDRHRRYPHGGYEPGICADRVSGSGRSGRDKCVSRGGGEKGYAFHTGVVQCKDAFYGQHEPETKPVSYELLNKWEAWKRLGCLASEMESAALFVVASSLGVRTGSCFLVVANQERRNWDWRISGA